MARIEGEQHNDTGRVREWLARAVNAPRDPAWTADGIVSDRWAAISPVTASLSAVRPRHGFANAFSAPLPCGWFFQRPHLAQRKR